MVIDESMLRAYVDGELDPATRAKVEAALTQSAELQGQVNALWASCLPYRTAFEAQSLPPLPATLQERVTTLAAVAGTQAVLPAGRRRWMRDGLALAASFAAGAFLPWRELAQPTRGAATTAGIQDPWVEPIAAYHSLYVRETVDMPADDPARFVTLVSDWGRPRSRALYLPDLRAAGLAFKRVQRLGFGHTPVIQMVYLPAQGKPVALCTLPTTKSDEDVRAGQVHGIGVAHWRRAQLGFVLAADLPAQQLAQLAEDLRTDRFASL